MYFPKNINLYFGVWIEQVSHKSICTWNCWNVLNMNIMISVQWVHVLINFCFVCDNLTVVWNTKLYSVDIWVVWLFSIRIMIYLKRFHGVNQSMEQIFFVDAEYVLIYSNLMGAFVICLHLFMDKNNEGICLLKVHLYVIILSL